MSAKRLLEMTHAWYDCKEELKRTQARLKKQEQLVECLKGEIKALRGDNDQLRYELLCSNCQRYLDGKQPGDSILMHVWGPKGIPKTGVKNKSRRVFSHDYKVEHAALSLLNHHGSVTV